MSLFFKASILLGSQDPETQKTRRFPHPLTIVRLWRPLSREDESHDSEATRTHLQRQFSFGAISCAKKGHGSVIEVIPVCKAPAFETSF